LVNGGAGRFDAAGIGVKSLDGAIVGQSQRRRKSSVTAANMDHQPAMEVRRRSDLPGIPRRLGRDPTGYKR
jgi:hypothetical protein